MNKYYPGRKINVNSGWRSVANNASCGGAAKSQHLLGKAIDFTISGVSVQSLGALISQVWNGGYQYKDPQNRFVHTDIRSYKLIANDV